MKSLSFREMSALGSALGIALVAWLYFPSAFFLTNGGDMHLMTKSGEVLMDKQWVLLKYAAGSIAFLIGLQIAYYIVIGIIWRRDIGEPLDERDKMVALKARKIGHILLAIGVISVVGYLFSDGAIALLGAQFLLVALFASEFSAMPQSSLIID